MDYSQAVILGMVQGLTEFLPVSSSGHLVLGQRLLGLHEPQLLFDVAVHVGTLAAVLVVFWRDIWSMVRGLWATDEEGRRGRKLIMLVAAASVPTAIMGLAFKDYFESMFASLAAVGVALLITGCLLMVTTRAKGRGLDTVNTGPIRALVMGVAQGMAITPGISRSGATIATGLLLGLDREFAARLSFVMSIPAILGALLLQVLHIDDGSAATAALPVMVAGGLTAALVGWAALQFLLKIVRQGRLYLFSYYCWALGLTALAWNFWGN